MNPDTALDELTKPWTDILSPRETGTGKYVPVDYPPLLDMLREAIGSSLGKTRSGVSSDAERSLLNLQAFQLWEHIDGTVRAWWQEVSKDRCPTELKVALRELAGRLHALHASNQIPTSRHEHITAQFPRWRTRIWEMFDPPVIKELDGACPACEATAFYAPDGGKMRALVAYYWKGIHPEAKCQCCGEKWVGAAQLVSLGKVLGATMDEEVLRAAGVA